MKYKCYREGSSKESRYISLADTIGKLEIPALATNFKEGNMSSIPISLGAVSKVRHQWNTGLFREKDNTANNARSSQSSYNVQDSPPAKYNDKLMNSIWGLYNRYAPPSFQKNSEGEVASKSSVALGGWLWNQHN